MARSLAPDQALCTAQQMLSLGPQPVPLHCIFVEGLHPSMMGDTCHGRWHAQGAGILIVRPFKKATWMHSAECCSKMALFGKIGCGDSAMRSAGACVQRCLHSYREAVRGLHEIEACRLG